jgi:hypothetical protein
MESGAGAEAGVEGEVAGGLTGCVFGRRCFMCVRPIFGARGLLNAIVFILPLIQHFSLKSRVVLVEFDASFDPNTPSILPINSVATAFGVKTKPMANASPSIKFGAICVVHPDLAPEFVQVS